MVPNQHLPAKALQVKLSTATTPTDLLLITKAVQKLQLGMVDAVATYVDMVALRRNTGDLVFVDSEQKLYYLRGGSVWTSIMDVSHNVWAWGHNVAGELGDNTSASKRSPVSVVGGFTDWIQVSAGVQQHSVGVRANGTAWAWGQGVYGKLGDGTAINKSSPVLVAGGFTDWIQVSAGGSHTVGIRSNGTAWAWGRNNYSQLGDNTTVNKSSPVSVVGGFTDWIQVSAGSTHTTGLRSNGTAWAWGRNFAGSLGDGTGTTRSSPVSVVGGFRDWIQVSAGANHTTAVRANGTAWAWGLGANGRLGDGTAVSKSSPVSVVGGFTDWVQVSTSNNHTIGIRANGTAWAWGSGPLGQLGDNTTVDKSSPVSVVGGFIDWVQVDAGGFHSAGLRANGTAWAWGYGGSGRLGDNTVVDKSSPVSVVGGFIDWVQVDAGSHTMAIR